MSKEVAIIGAGLAGLACARTLESLGVDWTLYESSLEPGGRVGSDLHEGFILDRGFQVLLTAYPEAQQVLDYSALKLHRFMSGAQVRMNGRFATMLDPWRHPASILSSLFSPVGSFTDKLQVEGLRQKLQNISLDDIFQSAEFSVSTMQALRNYRFSQSFIDHFFRPFFGGIFLERDLKTSSSHFEFIFKMFSAGEAALPASGMGAIPRQMAAALPTSRLNFGKRVSTISEGLVSFENGTQRKFDRVVVAVDNPSAMNLVPNIKPSGSRTAICLYFKADCPPIQEPILVLNGDNDGPVNNLTVPNLVAPTYAPPGAHLISATIIGEPIGSGTYDFALLRPRVMDQMQNWFGKQVESWKFLKGYAISHALPDAFPPSRDCPPRSGPELSGNNSFLCGDYLENASINGALVSGRKAAEAVLRSLS